MDIGIVWNSGTFSGDWDVTTSDLATDIGGLRSAVLLSLFTDAAAPDSYVPPGGGPFRRHGHWSDTFEGYEIGSLLWTLNRSIKSDDRDLLNTAQDICQSALQWLITEGVVSSVTVRTGWWRSQPNVIGITINIVRPQSPPVTFNFPWAWQGV